LKEKEKNTNILREAAVYQARTQYTGNSCHKKGFCHHSLLKGFLLPIHAYKMNKKNKKNVIDEKIGKNGV